jgi:ATP-dependent DNA helicase RecQ
MKNIISRGIAKALSRARPQQPEKSEAASAGDIGIQMPRDHSEILSRCLSIDLEVDPKEARIFAFAAVPEGEGGGDCSSERSPEGRA